MSKRRTILAQTLLPVFALLATKADAQNVPDKWSRVPGTEWTAIKPEAAGYSSARLEVLRQWLKNQQTTAMLIVVHGQVIFQYGDIKLAGNVASVRKSVLAMLYGNYVVSGKINLDKTVKELGLDDKQPFLPMEEHATLEQLLASRSGIYLPNGSFGQDETTPKRGSEYPGTHFFYNNWDFNAAGTAFEKLMGKNIYDALENDLAGPIGMQDFDRTLQRKTLTKVSVHPEYPMFLSTRDMARLGVLMARHGNWNGKQLIPTNWCSYIISPITPFDEINPTGLRVRGRMDRWGYGLLWWVWETPAFPGRISNGPLQGAYSAMGAGGQFITVLPQADMVIAHKVDIDKNPKASVDPIDYDAILAMVIGSKCSSNCK